MNLKEDTFAKEEGSLTAIDIKHEQTKEEICELEAEVNLEQIVIRDLKEKLKVKQEKIDKL